MTKYQLYRFSLFASIILAFLGIYFKMLHHAGGEDFLITGLLIALLFVIIGLTDIFQDQKRSLLEKAGWLLGFILFSWIAGLIYYFVGIKAHLSEKEKEDH